MQDVWLEGWLPSGSLSLNGRMHHMQRASLVGKAKAAVKSGLFQQATDWEGQRPDGPRRRLVVTLYRPRLLDRDNAYGVCKAVVDAVKELGYLVDDSERYAEIVVRQEKVLPKRSRDFRREGQQEGTLIHLEEIVAIMSDQEQADLTRALHEMDATIASQRETICTLFDAFALDLATLQNDQPYRNNPTALAIRAALENANLLMAGYENGEWADGTELLARMLKRSLEQPTVAALLEEWGRE